MTNIGPRGVNLPQELINLICNHIDESDIENDTAHGRGPEIMENLKNLRLVNKSLAAAGAIVLFRHLTITLSPSTAVSRWDDWGDLQPSSCPDLQIYQGLEHVPKIAASQFAPFARKITIQIHHNDSPPEKAPSTMDFLSNFDRFKNVKVLRYNIWSAIADLVEDFDTTRRQSLVYWHVAVIHKIMPMLQHVSKFLFNGPSWASLEMIPKHFSRLRNMDMMFFESPAPAREYPVMFADQTLPVERLNICWVPRMRADFENSLRVDFSQAKCPELRVLRLASIHTYETLGNFIHRNRKNLRDVVLDRISCQPETYELCWKSIFKALGRCSLLEAISLQDLGLLKISLPPLRMSSLRQLSLDYVSMDSSSLIPFILSNKDSLTGLQLQYVLLDYDVRSMSSTLQQGEADWVGVLDALLQCSNLLSLQLYGLQVQLPNQTTPHESFQGLLKAPLWQWRNTIENIPFPFRAKLIYYGEDLNFTASRDVHVYHKIGEVVRWMRARRFAWNPWNRLTEADRVTPWCEDWFSSLCPVRYIKGKKATTEGADDWDPVNGLHVEGLTLIEGAQQTEDSGAAIMA